MGCLDTGCVSGIFSLRTIKAHRWMRIASCLFVGYAASSNRIVRARALRDARERGQLLFRRHLEPFRNLLQRAPAPAAQPGFGIHLAHVAARGRDDRRRQAHAVSPCLAARRAALAASARPARDTLGLPSAPQMNCAACSNLLMST